MQNLHAVGILNDGIDAEVKPVAPASGGAFTATSPIPKGSASSEAGLRRLASLTPQEKGQSQAFEQSDAVRAELERAIASERNPEGRAALVDTYRRDFGREPPVGSFQASGGPPAGSRAAAVRQPRPRMMTLGILNDEPLAGPKPAEPQKTEGGFLSDVGKSIAGGAVGEGGAGSMLRGVGEMAREGGALVADVVNGVFGTSLRSVNPLDVPASYLEQQGQRILDSRSEAGKKAEAGATPQGNLLEAIQTGDFSKVNFGDDPNLSGYVLQGVKIVGQFAPQLAAAVLTRGQSVAKQLGAGALVGGSAGGGAAASQARETIDKLSDDELNKQSATYRELLAQGKSKEAARAEVREAAEKWAFRLTLPVSALGGAFIGWGIGKGGGRALERAATGVGARAGVGGAAGAIEEAAQETAEGVATNKGVNVGAGTDIPLGEGSMANAVMGAVAGGVAGGARGAVSGAGQGIPRSIPRGIPQDGGSGPVPAGDVLEQPGMPGTASERTTPESPATIAAQQKALVEARRPAQMFPVGTPEPPLPQGMKRFANERGVFHYNPNQISENDLAIASAAGRENEVLGLGPVSKAEAIASGAPIAVVERTPDGVEVLGALTTPDALEQTRSTMQQGAAQGNIISVEPPERAVAERAQSGMTRGVMGNTTQFSTEQGAQLAGRYAVIEADELTTSHDIGLNPSPDYPVEMQPRERGRAAYDIQVWRILNNLNPELLAENPMASHGAPIVGYDALVESGNGRVIALKRGYASKDANTERYRKWLAENAERFGIATSDVDKLRAPVLVRVRETPVNRAEFARQANAESVARMTAMETAKADAARIGDLADFLVSPDGDFNPNANNPFVRRFIAGLPVTEQNAMVDAGGRLSQDGYARIRNAVLAKAYGGNSSLLRMVESMDDNVRGITRALTRVAPLVAKVREDMAAGALADRDITQDVVRAVDEISRLRAEGKSLADVLAQGTLFGSDLTPEALALMEFLDANIRSPQKIAQFIENYLTAVESYGTPTETQGDMFGGKKAPPKSEIMAQARKGLSNEPDAAVPTVEAQQQATAPVAAAGAALPSPEPDTGRTEPRGQSAAQPASSPSDQRGTAKERIAKEIQRAVKKPAVKQRPENRKDLALRKRVSEMSDAEKNAALLTDHLTGLQNSRWMDENIDDFSHIIAFDADSLKWVNDHLGHDSGDALLKAWGEAIKAATNNGARAGGDEFFALANSREEAQDIASNVERVLREATITANTPDGEVTIQGIGVSFGIGTNRKAADEQLNQHKKSREAAGTRAGRGETPPGVTRKSAQGQQDQVDQGKRQDDLGEVAPAFGDKNRIFTKEAADRARELLRKRLGTLSANAPLDPEIIKAGIDLSGYYIEGGARKFAAYSAKMIEDLGEVVKPYLKSWYMAVKFNPGFDSAGMDSEASIEIVQALANKDGEQANTTAREHRPMSDSNAGPSIGGKPASDTPVKSQGDVPEDAVSLQSMGMPAKKGKGKKGQSARGKSPEDEAREQREWEEWRANKLAENTALYQAVVQRAEENNARLDTVPANLRKAFEYGIEGIKEQVPADHIDGDYAEVKLELSNAKDVFDRIMALRGQDNVKHKDFGFSEHVGIKTPAGSLTASYWPHLEDGASVSYHVGEADLFKPSYRDNAPIFRVPASRFEYENGDISNAYSGDKAQSDKAFAVNTFTHEGKLYTTFGNGGSAKNRYADAWELVPQETWRGDTYTQSQLRKLWDIDESRRGDDTGLLVTVKGKKYVLARYAMFKSDGGEDVTPPDAPTRDLFSSPVDEAAHTAATSPVSDKPLPTTAQKDAGNYSKGHLRISGVDIAIENPQGSVRSGEDGDGNRWEVKLRDHYGYIKRTQGKDGDHVDVFVKAGTPDDFAGDVYVVDQVVDGKFDEHKVMLGWPSVEDAREAYFANYSKGWDGLGAITAMPWDDFKAWIDKDTQKKPVGKPDMAGTALARPKQLFVVAPDGRRFPVEDYADASKKWAQYRDTVGGGVSGIGNGVPIVDQDGTVVARISYNGRVWPPGDVVDGEKALYEPFGEGELSNGNNRHELPAASQVVADERPKDKDGNPIFKKGERVVVTERGGRTDADEMVGRHGEIIEATGIRWTAIGVFGGRPNVEGMSYHYTLRTDAGNEITVSGGDIEPETGAAPSVVPDIEYEGRYTTPGGMLKMIQSAKNAARNSLGAQARARTPKSKGEHGATAIRHEAEAVKRQQAFDAWAKQYPDAAAKLTAGKPAAPAATATAMPETGGKLNLVESKHTKTGEKLWVVTMADRVPREEYTRLNALAKEHDGYYSSFRGRGAIPGFTFKSEDKAKQFMAAAVPGGAAPMAKAQMAAEIKGAVTLGSSPVVRGEEAKHGEFIPAIENAKRGAGITITAVRDNTGVVKSSDPADVFGANPVIGANGELFIDQWDGEPWTAMGMTDNGEASWRSGDGTWAIYHENTGVLEFGADEPRITTKVPMVPLPGTNRLVPIAHGLPEKPQGVAAEIRAALGESPAVEPAEPASDKSEQGATQPEPRFGSGASESLSAAEKALRELSRDKESDGDVLLGNGKFVAFDDAVRFAREGIESGNIRPVPAQVNFKLDIAMRDVDRVLAAAKAPIDEAPESGATMTPQEPSNEPRIRTGNTEQGNGSADKRDVAPRPTDSGQMGLGLEEPSAEAGSAGQTDSGTGRTDQDRGASGSRRERGGQIQPSGTPRDDGNAGDRPGAAGPVTSPVNYVITDADKLGEGGQKAKYRDNLAAISTLKTLEAEQRRATPDEQRKLARYVGWGGLKQAFDPENKDWAKEYAELKDALTPEEYERARRTILDAHYTSVPVVRGMYGILKRLGFDGGRVLEPSIGSGNFIGLMPPGIRSSTSVFGVELDPLTGRIAQHLYQKARIVIGKGFQDVSIPKGRFDLAIGNPPFGQQSIFDAENPDISKFSIHNFFFAKSLESLRPGGIMTMVVSRYFMDQQDSSARQWIAERAKLLGAIRLPYTAFKQNAGTEVVTDIIVLQKLAEGEKPGGESFLDTKDFQSGDAAARVNEYFLRNPRMVLGRFATTGSMYAKNELTVEPVGDESIADGLARVTELFPEGVYEPSTVKVEELTDADGLVPEAVDIGGFFVMRDGTIARRTADSMDKRTYAKVDIPQEATRGRIKGLVRVRDALLELMRAELSYTSEVNDLSHLRSNLNREYDNFKKMWGFINSTANRRAFYEDPRLPLLESLEPNYDPGVSKLVAQKRNTVARAPSADRATIFSKRVLEPYRQITHADNVDDALVASLNEKGGVDLDYMGRITGKSADTVAQELAGKIFENPEGGWQTTDQYLSGNVKGKLVIARAAAAKDGRFAANVAALEKVIPADIAAVDIAARLGAPFIEADIVSDFVNELLGRRPTVRFMPSAGRWMFDMSNSGDAAFIATWGTTRFPANMIIDALLNNKAVVVKDNVGTREEPKYVVNPQETQAAQAKADEVAKKFTDWVYNDAKRRTRIERYYNDHYNTNVERKYDGSHLKLPGVSPAVTLRPHQKNAIWRIIQDRRTLLDHVVGAGKTYVIVGASMEMRRLGLSSKPVIVVPNHLVLQWRDEFYKLYPNANILAATPKDFERKNRQRLFGRIATNDWDAVIVGHSSFRKIGMPKAGAEMVLGDIVSDIARAIEEVKRERGDRHVIRDMERIKDNLEAKMARLNSKTGAKDRVATFDEMGVDSLFVDEAHEFKNLMYISQLQNVAGLGDREGSGKGLDLWVKARYLQSYTGGRGTTVFATGTPVSNSLLEMYTMQRYMMYDDLKNRGIHLADPWMNTFGDTRAVYEVDVSGIGYRLKPRLAKFVNLPELKTLYNSFADVMLQRDLEAQAKARGERWPIPKPKTGKPIIHVAPRSELQTTFFGVPEFVRDEAGNIKFKFEYDNDAKANKLDPNAAPETTYNEGSILWKFENIKELTKKSKGEINALSVTNEARKAALDFRLVNPYADDWENSKGNIAAGEIKRIYDQWHDDKGTQLVFCDLSVPLSAKRKIVQKFSEQQQADDTQTDDDAEVVDETEAFAAGQEDRVSMDELMGAQSAFSVYDDLKSKLVKSGIPDEEIAFIHDYDTPEKKRKLFAAVNAGEIRILMGSTPKMGAGMNVQRRLVAAHHMDAPWRPSDLEQRNGRMYRQGNMFYERDPDGFEVEEHRYATDRTYDTRMWQLIQHKAGAVEQLRKSGVDGARVMDDTLSGEEASAADMKAAASGNPLILEEIKLRTTVQALEAAEYGYKRSRYALETKLEFLRKSPEREAQTVDQFTKLIERRNANTTDKFAITLDGVIYTEKSKIAGPMTAAAGMAIKGQPGRLYPAGEYRGFQIGFELDGTILIARYSVDGRNWRNIALYGQGDDFSPSGLITRLDNLLDGFEGQIEIARENAAHDRIELAKAEDELAKPFAKKEELEATRVRYREVVAKLQAQGGGIDLTDAMKKELAAARQQLRDRVAAGETHERAGGGDPAFSPMEGRRLPHPAGAGIIRTDGQAKTDIEALREGIQRYLRSTGSAEVVPVTAFRAVSLPDDNALQSIAEAYGKRVVTFRLDPSQESVLGFFQGVSRIADPDVIYLRDEATRPHLAILGHELAHTMRRDDPALFNQLVAAIRPYVRQAEYLREFSTAYPGMSKDAISEEFVGEVLSDGFMSDKFWATLGRENPSLLQQLVNAVYRLMQKAAEMLGYSPKTARYLNDFDQVMEIAGRTMARYSAGNVPGGGVKFSRNAQTNKIADLWDQYDDTGDLTIADLVNEIEALIDNEDIPNSSVLEDAVRAWREEKAYDTEISGRGDMDHANTAFENTIRSYLTSGESGLIRNPDIRFSRKVREQGIPTEAAKIVSEFADDTTLKAHADYKAAKAGDVAAAARLVRDLASVANLMKAGLRFGKDAIYVPVMAKEATGHNQIPNALAALYATQTGGVKDQGIVQSNEAHHTGARPLERMMVRPLFDGEITPGARYVLVDDVSTMGGTFAELADHIRAGGGEVAGVVSLVNAARSGDNLAPDQHTVRVIERRFGDAIEQLFSVKPAALTRAEAQYILNFKDVAALRNSSTSAIAERGRRLAAKGIPGSAAPEVTPKFSRADGATDTERRINDILAQRRGFKPLDALVRVPVQALKIDKATSAAYDYLIERVGGLIPQGVKAGLVSDYGIPEAVLDRRAAMQAHIRAGYRGLEGLLEKLGTLTRAESRIAYEWMSTQDKDTVAHLLAQLPPESAALIGDIEREIDRLSQEAVRLEQLSGEAYARNKHAYLRRTYEKYELGEATEQQKAMRARAIKILGDQYKGRGIVDPVPMSKIKSGAVEWWNRREADGKGDADLKGQRFIRLERRADSKEAVSVLPGMPSAPKKMGRLLEVAYWPENERIPVRMQSWSRAEVWEVRGTKRGDVLMWRDFTKAERERMGEIDEVRYAVARTFHNMVHDTEVGRYLEWLANTQAKPDEEALPVGAAIADASESLFRTFKPNEWVRVPDGKIAGTSVKVYGKLAGLYVPGPIWNDIRQIVNRRYAPLGDVYADVLKAWKISKTALSPAVHMNNVMANIIMADWHDVGAADVVDALRIIARPDLPAHKAIIARFEDAGGSEGMFVLSEIQREQLAPLLDALRQDVVKADGLSEMTRAANVVALLTQLRLRDAGAQVAQSQTAGLARKAAGVMMDAYQAEDTIFRMAAFLRAKRDGEGDLEAGRKARMSFLDYQINAPWIQMMRSTAFPFISFVYRAAPMLVETAARKPWKIMKLAVVAGALNAIGYALSGGDEDKERRLLPEEKAGRVLGGVAPKLIRMPWNDANGSPVFLDIRRFVPLGDVVDVSQGHAAIPLLPAMYPGGPLALVAELVFNRSLFTGKDIAKETDTVTEHAGKLFDHLFKALAPNVPYYSFGVLPETYSAKNITDAGMGRTDVFGREQSLATALASSVGVKIAAYPSDVAVRNAKARYDANVREIGEEIGKLRRERVQKGITEEEFNRRLAEQIEKRKKAANQFREKVTP